MELNKEQIKLATTVTIKEGYQLWSSGDYHLTREIRKVIREIAKTTKLKLHTCKFYFANQEHYEQMYRESK